MLHVAVEGHFLWFSPWRGTLPQCPGGVLLSVGVQFIEGKARGPAVKGCRRRCREGPHGASG